MSPERIVPTPAEKQRVLVAGTKLLRTLDAVQGIGGLLKGLAFWIAIMSGVATGIVQGVDLLQRWKAEASTPPPTSVSAPPSPPDDAS